MGPASGLWLAGPFLFGGTLLMHTVCKGCLGRRLRPTGQEDGIVIFTIASTRSTGNSFQALRWPKTYYGRRGTNPRNTRRYSPAGPTADQRTDAIGALPRIGICGAVGRERSVPMSRTKWAFAVFCVALVIAMGNAMGRADCVNCEGGPAVGFGASACRGPLFGTEPGFCEHPPSPCDNAWDGYCQEKLKWKQFWHKVGTGYWVPPRTRGPVYGAMPSGFCPSCRVVESSAMQPSGDYQVEEQDSARSPATKDEPAPAPGPPPLPEPMAEPDQTPEPTPQVPGQARVPWEFSR